jgi:DNA primase
MAGQKPGEGNELCDDQDRAVIARLNELADDFFRARLRGSWVPGYLEARGFSAAVQARWHAGHAPAAWDALTRHLRGLGYADMLIEQAGLARRSPRGSLIDTFRDRLILPVWSADGVLAGFIGRAPERARPGVPKYLNSPRSCLYDKGALLFGLWEAREALAAGACHVIVEGPFDAIAVTVAGEGRFVGIAPCGTALTARHVTALGQAVRLRAAAVLVAFDGDQAGYRGAARAYHLLCTATDNLAAVDFQPGEDPAHILGTQGPAALAEMLGEHAHPLADVVVDGEVSRWDRWLAYAEGQINAMRAAAGLIAAMPPAHVGRQVARLAVRLGLDHVLVTEAVTDEVSKAWAPQDGCPPSVRSRRGGRIGSAPPRV